MALIHVRPTLTYIINKIFEFFRLIYNLTHRIMFTGKVCTDDSWAITGVEFNCYITLSPWADVSVSHSDRRDQFSPKVPILRRIHQFRQIHP